MLCPIFWDDNYVSLMPGENAASSAPASSLAKATVRLVLAVDGWNVAASRPIVIGGER